MSPRIPERPTLAGLEQRWGAAWEEQGTYAFDRTTERPGVFSIDTPPPTASGALHIGHVFSYTHTDLVARFQRMRGKAVFYPLGWDDNGLPTERRAQSVYGVRCDPSVAYEPGLVPPGPKAKPQQPVSRRNFVELCHRLTQDDEVAFEELFRRLGLSVDWSLQYTTVGDPAQRVAQRAFLRNLARGEAYAQESPVLWDVDFRTAVAQAELEDREQPGAYHRIAFARPDGSSVHIETTRPELLPACVALVAHPDDERYQALFGTTVTTPLFGVEVPVHAHALAQPDKGSGIAMICTFGDTTDVIWWRELDLPVRTVVGRDGRLLPVPPVGVSDAGPYSELAGLTVKQAQRRIVELLTASGDLEGEPRAITHPVKFYERGDRPLEIVSSRQWYLRNGGRDAALRERMLERGRELSWHPPFMRTRYDNWVGGLAGDWLISRQRFFGVPFPVWYRLDDAGDPVYDAPLLPREDQLPVDPASDLPEGFSAEQRDVPGGFTADADVMDTWATSSLSPKVAARWEDDPDLYSRVYPMDLRPQAHEIIRTWLFSTVVRAHLEDDALPWSDAMISGWVVEPASRAKLSKSKGVAVSTPLDLLEAHGTDGVRYWAASARVGTDTAFDEGEMKVGRKLAVKLLNASKFALSFPDPGPGEVTEPLDLALLAALRPVVAEATEAYEAYDPARALERTEALFWAFCDDHIELVKARAYGDDAAAASACRALRIALDVLLRLFAPVLPFVTEEVWSWWREGSVHRAAWPTVEELEKAAPGGDARLLPVAAAVLGDVRRAKSTAKLSMRATVARLLVRAAEADLPALRAVEGDLRNAGVVQALVLEAGEPGVEVELAPVAGP